MTIFKAWLIKHIYIYIYVVDIQTRQFLAKEKTVQAINLLLPEIISS